MTDEHKKCQKRGRHFWRFIGKNPVGLVYKCDRCETVMEQSVKE